MSDQAPESARPSPDETDPAAGTDEVSTPPGVPQQEDRAQPGLVADPRPDAAAADSVEDSHGGTIDVEDEQPDPDTSAEETPEQRENTEASTEQPSQ